MADVLSEVLPLAIGVALSPLPVAAVLLMLLSRRERGNATAFLGTWSLALLAIVTAATLAGVSFDTSDLPEAWRVVQVTVGVLLIAAGAVAWRHFRRRTPGPRKAPAWLAGIDKFSPARASALAGVLLATNVKDAALTIASGSQIASAALPTAEAAVAIAAFTLVASSTIAIPVVVALAAGPRAEPHLRRWHRWTEWHGDKALAVIATGAGVLLVATGLRGL